MANAHEQDLKIIEFIKKPFDRIKVKFEKLDLSSCKLEWPMLWRITMNFLHNE